MNTVPPYPSSPPERDRWILARRPERPAMDPFMPHGYFLEQERSHTGEIFPVATIFLTNRECPWRCLMCDLWKTTVAETVPPGAIPQQIDYALHELALAKHPANQVKLYNGGSFFDPKAIPPGDDAAIAARLTPFTRVIVESHPGFVGDRAVGFQELLWHASSSRPALEVAIGLETAHAEILERLNKRMTLQQFSRASRFLQDHGIALRVFVLVKPPFLNEEEALVWAQRSIDFAFDSGATAVSLIPTRPGNGALDALREQGQFSPPKLATLERALDYGIALRRGRVFADLWDLQKFAECHTCLAERRRRLENINLEQRAIPPVRCPVCASHAK